jgi:hypothetical protein
MLRIPVSLRDRLLAVKGGRSLNREIEVRLERSFDIRPGSLISPYSAGALAERADEETKELGRTSTRVDHVLGSPRGSKASGIGSGSSARSASASKPRTKPCVHRISVEAFCKVCDPA